MKKLLFLLLMVPSFAFADTPRGAFEGLQQCLAREPDSCRDYFTKDSQALYQKVVTYDLARCVPKDVEYVSELVKDNVKIVRVRIRENDSERIARLAFSREQGTWKFDLPQTLAGGLGPKWQSYVNASEQAYLFMQQQMGGSLGCDAVKALAVQPKEGVKP